MRKRSVAVFMAGLALTGLACVTTSHVERPGTLDECYATAGLKNATVIYKPAVAAPVAVAAWGKAGGAAPVPARAELLRVDVENLQVRGVWAGDQRSPTYLKVRDIKAIEVRDRGRGAREGLLIGLLAGTAGGALVGYASGDDTPCGGDYSCIIGFTARQKAVIGGVLGAVTGTLIGLSVGAALGHVDRYEF
jgi:hypothetical protein